MTKTIAITAIVLVAVVLGLSTIAPALQQAFAHDVGDRTGGVAVEVQCPADFMQAFADYTGQHPDHNTNGRVCVKFVCPGEGPLDPRDPICKDVKKVFIDDIRYLKD